MATTLENLEQYTALADLEEAMSAVAQDMSEPWEWNRWQSAASTLLPYFADAPRNQSAWSQIAAGKWKNALDQIGRSS